MAYDQQAGTTGLRAEVVDSMVKQIAEPSYKFRQAVAVVSTNAWKNTFFREDPSMVTGSSTHTHNSFTDVPRGANFFQSDTNWEEVSVRIVKFAVETNIAWEDILSDDIDVQSRNLIRRTREITKAFDDHLFDKLADGGLRKGNGLITSFAVATSRYWDVSSAAILEDLMKASRLIAEQNYDVSDLMCFISPYDKANIMSYLANKGAQFPSIATDVVNNGRIGRLAGIDLIETNSMPASYALVVKPKLCATWKELVPLRSNVTEDPLKSIRIRIALEGALEITDPKAICLICNTKTA